MLVDPGAAWTVEGTKLRSKASNTPYEGTEFATSIALTMLRGTVTYRAEDTAAETTITSTK